MIMSLVQPLKWHGGKHYLAKKIVALMPPHMHYVEPFAGGLSVLLARDPNDKRLWVSEDASRAGVSEVVNDINGELMNFWDVLKQEYSFHQFKRWVEAIPLSRLEYDRYENIPDHWPRWRKAAAFFVRARQSRAGTFKGFTSLTRSRTRRGVNGNASEWLGAVDGLAAVHARLRPVVLECMSALEMIPREDTPETLFYCLPPGELVRTEDEQLVPIESVQEGERLFGGRTVKAVLSKQYNGLVLSIKVQGLPRRLRVTADHPMVRIAGRQSGRQDKRDNDILWKAREVVPADSCGVGDYLLIPTGGLQVKPLLRIDRRPAARNARRKPTTFSHCPELYRLIGYYAAEGHLAAESAVSRSMRQYKPHAAYLSFGTHEEQSWVADAVDCIKAVFDLSASVKDNGASVLQVGIFSTTVARALSRWVPGTARTKSLHPCLMTAPVALQRHLLTGWLRGDGGLEDDERGRAKLLGTSASYILVEQMFRIALRCGLRPSYKCRGGRIHDIYFASEDAEHLGWRVRAKRFCSTRRVINGYLLARIRDITSEQYSGAVYDLDVDGDDLFAAPYALIHNCDPPYLHETRETTDSYVHEMTAIDHEGLLCLLSQIKGKFMLSGYRSAMYDLYASRHGWNRHDFEIANHASGAKEKRRMVECLWTNY